MSIRLICTQCDIACTQSIIVKLLEKENGMSFSPGKMKYVTAGVHDIFASGVGTGGAGGA